MPGRDFSSENYRFGFNSKEDDNEVNGNGNWQDYDLRLYNPRLGRFSSIDPITHDFAMFSPYHFAANSPIASIDMDGLENLWYVNLIIEAHFGANKIKSTASNGISNVMNSQMATAGMPKEVYHKMNPTTVSAIKTQKLSTGLNQIYSAASLTGHLALDIFGYAPVVGEGFDAANAAWYASEGDYFSASISAVSVIPVFGDLGKPLKYAVKGINFSGEILHVGNDVYASFKNADNIELEVLAERVLEDNGKTLVLKDIATYVKGAVGDEYVNMMKADIKQYRNALVEYAKAAGFEKLRITGTRTAGSSSAKKGKEVILEFDLKK